LHFGAVTQPPDAERSFIGMMNIVENCHAHRLAPNRMRPSTSSERRDGTLWQRDNVVTGANAALGPSRLNVRITRKRPIRHRYSITSSAVASSLAGTSKF
jgi:hypothetical protein